MDAPSVGSIRRARDRFYPFVGHWAIPLSAAPALVTEAGRWSAFGWFAQEVDGNDLTVVGVAFHAARNRAGLSPRDVIATTTMCKDEPFPRQREITHFVWVEPDERAKALAIWGEGHLGMAYDVAGFVLLLASDLGEYVTGSAVNVNGGSLIH